MYVGPSSSFVLSESIPFLHLNSSFLLGRFFDINIARSLTSFHLPGGATCTYAVTKLGELYAWGTNEKGQLGVGDSEPRVYPTKIRIAGAGAKGDSSRHNKSQVVKVSSGQHHCCAITSGGSIYCWGCNSHSQLGHPRSTIQMVWVFMPSPSSLLLERNQNCFFTFLCFYI
jgi:alpha-tubulin suppressor-like RCC1 family protein